MSQVITTQAIYQHGIIKLPRPLNLPNGATVAVSVNLVHTLAASVNDFGSLCGIWAGKGDLTYAEIEAVTHDVIMEHQTALWNEFDSGGD